MHVSQAKALQPGDRLHYTGEADCSRKVGPRGGVTTHIVEVRVTGQVKTWKKDPNRVKVPIKHGFYTHGHITEDNLEHFHLPEDCPLPPLVAIAPPADPVDYQDPNRTPFDGPEPDVVEVTDRSTTAPISLFPSTEQDVWVPVRTVEERIAKTRGY